MFVSSISTLSLTLSTHIFCVPVIGRRALDNFVRCENKPSMLRRGKICQYANKFYQRGSTPEPLAALLTRFSANLTLEKSKTEQIAANARPFVVFNGPRFSWLAIAVRSLSPAPPRRKLFLAGERDCWREGKKHLSFAQVRKRVVVGEMNAGARWIGVTGA